MYSLYTFIGGGTIKMVGLVKSVNVARIWTGVNKDRRFLAVFFHQSRWTDYGLTYIIMTKQHHHDKTTKSDIT